MLQGPREEGALLRGIDPAREGDVSVLAKKMVDGTSLDSLKPGEFNIVLGRELALWLGVGVGDSVIVYTPAFQSTPLGTMVQTKRFRVTGIFEAGYQEFDRNLAVVHIADAQRLLRMGDGVTGVRLRLHDMNQATDVSRELARRLAARMDDCLLYTSRCV